MCFSYDDFFGAKKKIPSKRKSEVNDRSEDSDTGDEQEDSDIGDEQEDSDMGDEQDDDEAFENKVFFIYFYMLIEIN
jgi:U3 small nucleolar ribonucleoprotein component